MARERRWGRLVEGAGDSLRRLALLRQDPLDRLHGPPVADARRDELQLLVAADLDALAFGRRAHDGPC